MKPGELIPDTPEMRKQVARQLRIADVYERTPFGLETIREVFDAADDDEAAADLIYACYDLGMDAACAVKVAEDLRIIAASLAQ